VSKRLFKLSVSAEFEMMVMAESETEASRIARANADTELGNHLHSNPWNANVIPQAFTLDPDLLDSLPYGGDGETSVREILEAEKGKPES
jgi:hypothetical protein